MHPLLLSGNAVRRLRRIFVVAVIVGGAVFLSVKIPLPAEDFGREAPQSLRIVDRHGVLLRECLNDNESRAQWVPLEEVAPVMVQATIAIEDRRFNLHPGVDPFALARALVGNLRAMSFRSGGSTITQQVIRNVYHHPRTIAYKMLELWDALRLEQMMSKRDILEQYLNRVPYGNQLVGVEKASRMYFGKPAKDLSLAESAFLAGLPNAPSVLNPKRNLSTAIARQRRVLRRMFTEGFIQKDDLDRALDQPLDVHQSGSPFLAAHVTDMVLEQFRRTPGVRLIRTAIDASLQRVIEILVSTRVASLARKNVSNGAVVVLDNTSGEIRALVGSADYFDSAHNGNVNGALALRQPGSAIKPLMYALALERGFTGADVLPDLPTAFPQFGGDYVPDNYDRRYHGPVRLRTALACSYNIPAVRVLHAVGKESFLARLREAGLTTLTEDAEHYGYGLTLGNGEVTLLALTNAYAALANRGEWKPTRLVLSVVGANGEAIPTAADSAGLSPSRQVYDEKASFQITDILSDPVARRPAFGAWFRFPFACAVKTGTTKDYRDNWTVGYTDRYTVGVWVGNFDGSTMRGVSGVSGAGPLFSDIMILLHTPPTGFPSSGFTVPAGLQRTTVCTLSGLRPGKYCRHMMDEWFLEGAGPTLTCTMHQAFHLRDMKGGYMTRIYQVLPPEYADWAESQHLPRPPVGAVRINEDLSHQSRVGQQTGIAIVNPRDGDWYRLDPILRHEFQQVKIVGAIPAGCRNVKLRIDRTAEREYTEGGVPWILEKGKHVFQLVGMLDGREVESRSVTLSVD
jgi:penicillin-binding protein 1C